MDSIVVPHGKIGVPPVKSYSKSEMMQIMLNPTDFALGRFSRLPEIKSYNLLKLRVKLRPIFMKEKGITAREYDNKRVFTAAEVLFIYKHFFGNDYYEINY